MKRRILPFILAGAVSAAVAAPVAATHTPTHVTNANNAVQNALVGLIVQANVRDVVDINISDSLNNLLRNADIDVNVLNNLLQNANIDVNVLSVTFAPETGDIVITFDDLSVLTLS